MSYLTPKEIVAELEKYIIGQNKAKKAVAIALRNRYRRSKLDAEMREEITPKNIIDVYKRQGIDSVRAEVESARTALQTMLLDLNEKQVKAEVLSQKKEQAQAEIDRHNACLLYTS